ncbi:MAG: hypothetical protein IKP58_10740, partial [Victivallales bacterium]|nr:hypothetical protein [Victivallales bacterium]
RREDTLIKGNKIHDFSLFTAGGATTDHYCSTPFLLSQLLPIIFVEEPSFFCLSNLRHEII